MAKLDNHPDQRWDPISRHLGLRSQQENAKAERKEVLEPVLGHCLQHPQIPACGEETSIRPLGLPDPGQEASILLAKGSVVLTDLLQVAQSLLAHLCLNLRQHNAHIFSMQGPFPSPCWLPLYCVTLCSPHPCNSSRSLPIIRLLWMSFPSPKVTVSTMGSRS